MLQRADPSGASPTATQFVVDGERAQLGALEAAKALLRDVVEYVSVELDAGVVRGAVVARGEAVLGLVGPADRTTLLAAHLTARGWALLAPEFAFATRDLTIIPFPTLMHVTATHLDRFPKAYRRAIETSAWCSGGGTLHFYAVDPIKAKPMVSWQAQGRLSGMLVLDEQGSALPEVTPLADDEHDAVFSTAPADLRRARLSCATMPLTATLVERWAENAA
jgi:hypothetical protein